jgi:hypothetical protein
MRETGLAKTIGERLANALNISNLVSITIMAAIFGANYGFMLPVSIPRRSRPTPSSTARACSPSPAWS